MNAFWGAFLLGVFGQVVRVALGWRKWRFDPDRTEPFDWRFTLSSVALGGLAGMVASLVPAVGQIGIVAAGYAGADAIEGLLGRYLPGGSAVMSIMVALAVSLAVLLGPSPASAMDPTGKWATSPWHAWFEAQRNHWVGPNGDAVGESCCGNSDAYAFNGRYEVNADGSVTVYPDHPKGAEAVTLPAWAVLPFGTTLAGSNPTGGAVWWRSGPEEMASNSYCFALAPPRT